MRTTLRRTAVATAGALVVIAAIGVAVPLLRSRPPAADPPAPAVKTTTVRKADLANTRSLAAELGFGAPRPVKGTGTGTVTKLPAVGDVAERGEVLFRVDDQPVTVFFGATPFFRRLEAPGTKGSDVAVLMDNLAALGHQVGLRPDDDTKAEFTPKVVAALKRWQQAVGVEQTGALDPGRVLVLDGPARVASVKAQLGATPTEELFEVTPTTRLVTARVPAPDAGGVTAAAPVLVVLPDGRETPGKIASTAPLAPPPDGGQDPRVEVVVTLDRPDDVTGLATAPVQVKITTESRTGVLTVPLEALIALKEGGYALQLPDGGLKAVKTGLYSLNRVEVSGDGIVDGLQVVTAQ
ncbi:peptidoglycan-binding protein [Umezawaea endophytica]|uniref:Peptidoglycan-binding protein n=1 Tax=Umezawaea endophytica TaxID=1654476 RepID=A0A9X3ADK2_9PSEU|nr:peptidoglycan-binding protein [Umezawaea endophytica]MCS7475786.1 peptidoglycan-binding protein [Umezawaea endophytica]